MRGRRNADDDAFWYYEPSRPIEVRDGIKARSKTGSFGGSWWAKRWIGVLETFGWGSRLQRGRTYARKGQVLTIELDVGQVRAKVQGSRPTPYTVTLNIRPLNDTAWDRVIAVMAQQAMFAARLLNGDMPQTIEEAFTGADVALFPEHEHDIRTRCSCPDVANPCKHIAAVYYLLGERFDDDPFLIFHLRGRTRAHLIEALRRRRAAIGARTDQAPAPAEPVAALSDQLDHFYQAGVDLAAIAVPMVRPEVEASVLRQMGVAPAGIDADLRALYCAMTMHVFDNVFGNA